MKNMKWIPKTGLISAMLLLLAGCPDGGNNTGEGSGEAVRAAQLSVTLADGAKSGAVTYEVRVDGGPAEISAFGLDISFDPAVLSYVGWEKGSLTGGFTQVGANNIDADTVRVGGFTVDEPVPVGATGTLATLQFEATGSAPGALSIADTMDNIETFSTTR